MFSVATPPADAEDLAPKVAAIWGEVLEEIAGDSQASAELQMAARDLMRCRAGGTAGRALELATFRLLFAAGDPVEGARAFLEKRPPRFSG